MANNKIITITFFLYATKYVVKIKLASETGKKISNWSATND